MTVHASDKYVYSTTVITCIESADSTSPTRFTNSLSSTWRMAWQLCYDHMPTSHGSLHALCIAGMG